MAKKQSSVERSPDKIRDEISLLVEEYSNFQFGPKSFVKGQTPIPASGKLIGVEEITNLVQASLDGWLTAGRFNSEFEVALANFIGAKHVLTVNSGSSANLVAFHALTSPKLGDRAIRPGDEVITVAAGSPQRLIRYFSSEQCQYFSMWTLTPTTSVLTCCKTPWARELKGLCLRTP